MLDFIDLRHTKWVRLLALCRSRCTPKKLPHADECWQKHSYYTEHKNAPVLEKTKCKVKRFHDRSLPVFGFIMGGDIRLGQCHLAT